MTGLPADVTVEGGVASPVDLSGVTLADVDAGNNLVAVTLTVSAGTLAAISGGGVTVGDSGTGTLTLTGAIADINTFLDTPANVTYVSVPGALGNDAATLTVSVNDNGNTGSGGALTASGIVNIDVQEQRSLIVTTLNDVVDAFDGKTSLREAIAFANSGDADGIDGNADTITFASGLSGTIRLGDTDGDKSTAYDSSLGTLQVTQALTINGDGRITITGDRAGDDTLRDGTDITDIFATAASERDDNTGLLFTSANLTVQGLTLTGGVSSGNGGAVGMTLASNYL